MSAAEELNSDYNPESRDALAIMLGKVVGSVDALTGKVDGLTKSFGALETSVTQELKDIRKENADDHERVAGLLTQGGERMGKIETDVGHIKTAVEADPGGLVDHERRIRFMEPNVWRWVNLRKWLGGLLAALIVVATSVALTLFVQRVTAVSGLADTNCQSRLEALDEGQRREERPDTYYTEQFSALAAGGCVRPSK